MKTRTILYRNLLLIAALYLTVCSFQGKVSSFISGLGWLIVLMNYLGNFVEELKSSLKDGYEFSFIISPGNLSDEEIVSKLYINCKDALFSVSKGIYEVNFHSIDASLKSAVGSARCEVERAGLEVKEVKFHPKYLFR